MAEYLTYEEYQEFGGTLPETEFEMAEFQARKRIDYWTDSRVQNMSEVPEAVKRCIMLTDHDMITQLPCTGHVTDHALFMWLIMH